jgi:glycosyltransferase involved in cell wall biosynthesis
VQKIAQVDLQSARHAPVPQKAMARIEGLIIFLIFKPMNILIINSAKEWGGNEKWSLAAAEGLARRGHRVYFGCRSPVFRERAGDAGVSFVRFPCAHNADVFSIVAVMAFLCSRSIDVVIPTKQREYFLGGLAALPLRRVKTVARLGIDRPLHNPRNRFVFRHLLDGVIVNAASIVRTLGKTAGFNTSLCRVVRNGVTVTPLSAATRDGKRNELGIDKSDFCIMGIGRLAPQKGFDYAIEAFALLSGKYPNARLVIVGPGDSADLRRQAARAGADKRLVFAGFRSDIQELVQAADLYWLTSRSEGLPNAMLEAMAAKVPVVAFDVAGVGEVLREGANGLMVPFGNVDRLAAATARLMDEPELRKRTGEAGYQTVTEEFSMEKMIADTEMYLKELCKK